MSAMCCPVVFGAHPCCLLLTASCRCSLLTGSVARICQLCSVLCQRTASSTLPTSMISAKINKLCDGRTNPDTRFVYPYFADALIGLLDICGHKHMVRMVLQLCRH